MSSPQWRSERPNRQENRRLADSIASSDVRFSHAASHGSEVVFACPPHGECSALGALREGCRQLNVHSTQRVLDTGSGTQRRTLDSVLASSGRLGLGLVHDLVLFSPG